MSTVLIVDDHSSFRLQARAVLEAAGFVVVGEAADGRSGIALAAALRPEVVLLDIGLPDIDGFEVAGRLAAAQPGIAIVLTSSREATEYGFRLNACTAVGFLPKDQLSGSALAALVAAASPTPANRQ
jgi:DNA-binding NarL/FixJ family response regulator